MAMDKRKQGYPHASMNKCPRHEGTGREDLIAAHHHRIPHIQTKVVDTVAYSTRRPALIVKGGSKMYGNTHVLHNLNMFAKEGTIYCLVGASNTGKSTILSCITGLKRLTKGELLVFGATPGSAPSGIPGRRIGFCPQELALHTELTITEVLQYHGRLHGLSLIQIKERTDVLSNLLDLQHFTTRLENLSPGLQKRTSLACSLIHEPELIVLDQPTTGMDILFQKGIWMHLQKLVSNGRTSVILSVQNVEEARQAHRVGVLRSGRLLIEDSPASLLQKHGTQLLAEAVAKLSIKDTIRIKNESSKQDKANGKGKAEVVCMDEWTTFGLTGVSIEDTQNGVLPSVSYKEWMEQVVHGDEDQINNNKLKKSMGNGGKIPRMNAFKSGRNDLPAYANPSRISNRLRALFIKQFLVIMKNFWIILMSLIVPAVLITAFCHTIGQQPMGIRVGLVNNDTPGWTWKNGSGCMVMPGCANMQLSCRFLDKIPSKAFEFEEFETESMAQEAIEDGKIFGNLYFDGQFSIDTHERINSGVGSFNESNFRVVYDDSNVYTSNFIQDTIRRAFEDFESELLIDCNSDPVDRNISVSFEPAFSNNEKSGSYIEHFVPSITFLIAFFITTFSSGIFYLRERQQGLISRSKVAAVNNAEVLFVHIVYQLPIIFLITAILVVIPLFVFQLEPIGFWVWSVALIAVGAFSGMSFSFLLSTVFNEVRYIFVVGIFSLITGLLLSGIAWPTESQHWILQWVSFVLPWTLPSEAHRSIMNRGWDIMHQKVWMGFASLGAWTLTYWIIIVLVLSARYFRR